MSELDELVAGLVPDRGRTAMDRYGDFRQLFLGTDQGKRVLSDLLDWAHIWRATAVRGDAYETYRREGERNMGLKILASVHIEPGTPLTHQNITEED